MTWRSRIHERRPSVLRAARRGSALAAPVTISRPATIASFLAWTKRAVAARLSTMSYAGGILGRAASGNTPTSRRRPWRRTRPLLELKAAIDARFLKQRVTTDTT